MVRNRAWAPLVLLAAVLPLTPFTAAAKSSKSSKSSRPGLQAIVFVSRSPLPDSLRGQVPGLGPHGTFAGAGGRLLERGGDGRVRELVPSGRLFDVADPSVSADGTRVAFTARGAGETDTGVYVHDLTAGTTVLASRATGAVGPPAFGGSSHPSLSADGTRVAFTSDAYNLSPAKCNPARGIFVRDLASATTTLVSSGDGLNRGIGPTKGSGGESAMRIALLCASQTPSSSSEL